jgi:hypothetical protein
MAEEEPSAEAQELERLRQANAELESRLRAQRDSEVDSRLSEMERAMQEKYRAVRQAPSAPQPEPAYQAQQELGITDEEILANPRAAIERISEHIANQRLSQMQDGVVQVLRHQVKRGFDSEMESLRNHPYYNDLAPVLREHFDANPHEMIEAGAVKRRFNELVGENLDTLTKLAAEREAKRKVDEESQRLSEQPGAIARNRVVEPSIRAGSAPLQSSPSQKEKETELDKDPSRAAAKRDLIDIFNRVRPGLDLTEEEFVAIEKGDVFPKKVAADYQVRGGKPNVEY